MKNLKQLKDIDKMKPVKASEKTRKLIKHFESRKAYIAGGDKIRSKIIAHSKDRLPSYFIRADYETGAEAKKTPIAYWQINNPFIKYFEDKKSKIENLKKLIKTEKKLGLPSHRSKTEYKAEKERYEFLTEIRKVSDREITERIQEDILVFIK